MNSKLNNIKENKDDKKEDELNIIENSLEKNLEENLNSLESNQKIEDIERKQDEFKDEIKLLNENNVNNDNIIS